MGQRWAVCIIVGPFVLLSLTTQGVGQSGRTTRVSISFDGGEGNNPSHVPSISADGRFIAFYSAATRLVQGDTNGKDDVFVYDRTSRQTTRVSVASDGSQADKRSYYPSISADGRFVAFVSDATNLVGDDTNGAWDVFVHDRQTGETTRVSVASDGTQGNSRYGNYRGPSISADGRFVAFNSDANNLVSDDTNDAYDVFVHDRQTDETTRVSVASDGSQGNGPSSYPSISADGRLVAFESHASNLVPGDTNGRSDIFIRDRSTGETSRVSVASDGLQADGNSAYASLSADGRLVAFYSDAKKLVRGDTNRTWDIFVNDRATGKTRRVSVASDGSQANNDSIYPSISADGRYVAFESYATNLVAGDLNGSYDIFVHDRQTRETALVSVAFANPPADEDSTYPAISGDGRFIAFESKASNLIIWDSNGVPDIFLRDRSTCPDAVLRLKCKSARDIIVARVFGLEAGQTLTISTSCGGSLQVTADGRGNAKATFKHVSVEGCQCSVQECTNLTGACP